MHWITTNPSGFHGVDSLDAIAHLGASSQLGGFVRVPPIFY